jgi:hypothetical protein
MVGYLFRSGGMYSYKPAIMKSSRLAIALCLLCFLFSCQNDEEKSDSGNLYPLSDTTSVTGLTGDSVKLVKTAATSVKVKDVEQSTRAVSSLAQKLGGMLTLQNLEAVEQGRKELKLSSDSLLVITAVAPRADITARVPSQHLEAFLFGVADLGYLTTGTHLQVDDKSLSYLENALKQANRAEVLAQPTAKRKSQTATLQTIVVKDEAIEQNMANRAIDADVNFSTVNLNLFQNAIVRKETIANPYLDNYGLPFWKRFGNALENGWVYFLSFVVAIAHLWMFIAAGVLVMVVYRYWQQRRKLI